MNTDFTEADEIASLRYIVAMLLVGIGKPVTAMRGKEIVRYCRGDHNADLVERARQHFEGRKDKRLLERLEALEEALRPLTAHAPHLLDMIEDERPVPWLTQITYGDVRRAAAVLERTDEH